MTNNEFFISKLEIISKSQVSCSVNFLVQIIQTVFVFGFFFEN